MCNCGKKRNHVQPQVQEITSGRRYTGGSTEDWKNMLFQYTGKTALTVTGSVTGKLYRFHQTGNIQSVDYRDAPGMRTVPVLKKVI